MSSLNILIADDHELFRRMVRSFIESQPDYRVCGEAGDGIEAVEKVRQLRPDVVLMDINMPRMDGLEATRIIRREIPDCNVIIVTQNHATIAREQARSVKANGSVTKSDLRLDLIPTLEKVRGNAKPEAKEPREDANSSREWLRAGGALGKLVNEFDWAKTPLGSIDQWPAALKTIVRMMLTSRFAMWMSWGPELTFLYNDAYARMTLGHKHPWALGKPSEKVWEEIWGDIGPRIRKVLESGQATWDEALLLFLERSGYREETYHTFSYSPLAGDDGKVTGHLCVVTEETDRVIGERRLKTLRSLATDLNKTITEEDVVASVSRSLGENQQDLPFTLTYLFSQNGQQARLACCSGIVAGHAAAPKIIEVSQDSRTWPTKELLDGRDSVIVDDLARRFGSVPAGSWAIAPARALLLPIASQAQGTPAGVLVAALNPYRPLDVSYAGFVSLIAGQIAASIADARAYEEEKKRAEALAEINRAKTVFFSNVSHEFRTPLTLMLAPLEDILADPVSLAPDQRERLDIAHRNSLRLLKLVNTLLDFSRIEAGRFQASYEPTDISQLTSDLGSVFRSAIQRAGLQLIVNCPSIAEPVYVDRELWEKIVFNLLSNAFKFTFQGEIEISIRKSGGRIELAVRDTGTGIPTEDLPHLFERFYRVKNAQGRTFEGSGIGLALVQELARQNGGTVRVESELGRGSTFTVSIPLGSDHLPADRIGAPRTLASTALRGDAYVEEALHWLPGVQSENELSLSPTLSSSDTLTFSGDEERSRVLIVDDNADMREYLRQLLSSSYDVQALPDGVAALEAIRRQAPDLILADVMMPKLDGFGLLKELRSDKDTAPIPVILISARAGEESRVEGLSAGADDYLTKPFSARELLARVKSHLNMARIRREAAEVERDLRTKAELARREVEERECRLRSIIDALPVAIYTTDAEGWITQVNPAGVEFSGRAPQLGTDRWSVAWKLFRSDGTPLPNDECPMAIALREGKIVEGTECIAERPDGTRAWFTAYPRPLRDGNGNIVGGINMLVDITARKRAEEATGHLAAIVASSDDAIVSKNLDGVIQSWNQSAERMFGYTAEEAIGQHITLIIPKDRWDEEADIIARLRRGEKVDHFQTVRRRKDGTTLDLSLTISPVKDSGGRVIGASKVARDITHQIAAERALRASEERFRKLSETLDAEVRARTRELEVRNADVVRQSEQLRQLSWRLLRSQDEERRHIARELHDSAGQTLTVLGMNVAQLVQNVRRRAPDIAADAEEIQEMVQQLHREIRTTSYLLHPPLLDENGLYSAISWYVQGLLERSDVDIRLDISEDLGRLPRDMELVVFRLVQECLTNIHRHSESKTASIRMAREGNEVTLDIRDQGKGMSPERLAEIQAGRTGVGIRGMRERLRQFEGTVNIESNRSGTRVFVTIPIPDSATSKQQTNNEPLQAAV
jgi:PAS domain S-box-containing protein